MPLTVPPASCAPTSQRIQEVCTYLEALQDKICKQVCDIDQRAHFLKEPWEIPAKGRGLVCSLKRGKVFEKAGVNFSSIHGDKLPSAASLRHTPPPNACFQAVGLSLVFHPHNPYIPTVHCNLRFFCISVREKIVKWWFGGGYDLTPFYPNLADVLHWHQNAKHVCDPFGEEVYPQFKNACDKYFFLPHRAETRGVGGLFFDDLHDWGFVRCFSFLQGVGESFIPGYFPIIKGNLHHSFGRRERNFQRYRRARYVEFNLLYDRGTLFGLQSGGRTEAIFMSMPPGAAWEYAWHPKSGSKEAELHTDYLHPRDWLTTNDN